MKQNRLALMTNYKLCKNASYKNPQIIANLSELMFTYVLLKDASKTADCVTLNHTLTGES